MTERPDATFKEQVAHGHTRLIWLLDDVEAHLQGLHETDGEDLILEELVSFARAFTEELDEHIDEEETEIFPAAEAVAADAEHAQLEELDAEHRRLQAQMKEFWALMARAREEEQDRRHVSCLDELFDKVRSIREHLTSHSVHERTVLAKIEPRIEPRPSRA